MSTPLYDELVVKYYLSQGIKPFSYPHEPVGVNAVPKVEVSIGVREHRGPVDPTAGKTYDLISSGRVIGTANGDRLTKTYDYFRL